MKIGARCGYTLVELLVVLAIIGVLISISVPALMGPLQNARRLQCQNRLRQLSLALESHHLRRQAYPGYLQHFGDFSPSGGPIPSHAKVGTWATALMNDLDRLDISEVWTDDQTPLLTLQPDHQIPGTIYDARKMPNLDVMVCPSDSNNERETHGMNSFCAASGMWPSERVTFASAMRSANGVFLNQFTPADSLAVQGSHQPPYTNFPKPRSVRADQIRDAKSQTVAFTENLQAEPWYRVSLGNGSELLPENVESQIDPNQSRLLTGVVWQWMDDHGANSAPYPSRDVVINGGDRVNASMQNTGSVLHDLARPSSNHIGGVNMAFLDGSVRFISQSIEYRVYVSLMTPNTRESDAPEPRHVLSEQEL